MVLATSLTAALLQWQESTRRAEKAEQQTLAANYHLAKFYEEKALNAMAEAGETGESWVYRDAWLFAAAAALQDVPKGKQALEASTIGRFLDRTWARDAFSQHWSSPTLDLGISVSSVAFSPDGQFLASAQGASAPFTSVGNQFAVHLWDAEHGVLVQTFNGHKGQINDLAFSPDSQLLATASLDNTIRLWNTESGKLERIFEGSSKAKVSGGFRPALPGTVLEIASGGFRGVAFNPDERMLASVSVPKTRIS